MNNKSLVAATALAALLAGAPVAVFAQSTSTGATSGSSMSGANTTSPSMGTGSSTMHQPMSSQSYNNNTSQPGSTGMSSGSASNTVMSSGQHYSGTSSQSYNGSTSGQPGSMSTGGMEQGEQLSQSTMQDVQQQLQQQGFYRNGKVDGRWGPETRQAVEHFQRSKGMQVTGQLDQQTLDALGVKKGG